MLTLKAILLTQGMHGMVSQVEGLARALGLSYKHQNIELKSFWNLIPPKFAPISENLVKEKFICDSRVVISCGRKSVIPSIALKKRLGKEIFTIHIQDPKVSFKHFDLIISPEHDGIKGENVFTTKGAIHYLTKNKFVQYELLKNISKVNLPETIIIDQQININKIIELQQKYGRIVKKKISMSGGFGVKVIDDKFVEIDNEDEIKISWMDAFILSLL